MLFKHLSIHFLSSVLSLSLTLSGLAATAAEAPLIIPQPVELSVTDGAFVITVDTQIVAEGEAVGEARKLMDALAPALGYRLPQVKHGTSTTRIEIELVPVLGGDLGEEGYTLRVTPERIVLNAAQPAGLFYGSQTLLQLLPPAIYRKAPRSQIKWTIPCVEITDYPRFGWRGLLVDPARHFIPKRDLMRYIDAMAMHKFNRLQIHLTDGQGWRVEIRKYPLLTEISSHWHHTMEARKDQGKIYSGYYSQEDVRELVQYATERHITLVPEIEMPGHAGAAIETGRCVRTAQLVYRPDGRPSHPTGPKDGRLG